MGQSVCRLMTRSTVYFTGLSLEHVEQSIQAGRLILVWDDNDHRCWLNPAAILTVEEESR